jgi:hypothetical protein
LSEDRRVWDALLVWEGISFREEKDGARIVQPHPKLVREVVGRRQLGHHDERGSREVSDEGSDERCLACVVHAHGQRSAAFKPDSHSREVETAFDVR